MAGADRGDAGRFTNTSPLFVRRSEEEPVMSRPLSAGFRQSAAVCLLLSVGFRQLASVSWLQGPR